jgi:hypothetical protein
MPAQLSEGVRRLAEENRCGLASNGKRDVFFQSSEAGSSLDRARVFLSFSNALESSYYRPLDIVNPKVKTYFSSSEAEFYSFQTLTHHIPHYVDFLLLDNLHGLQYGSHLDAQMSCKLYMGPHSSTLPSPLTPTVLLSDNVVRKTWILGMHELLRNLFPGSAFLDMTGVKRLDPVCFRSALVTSCGTKYERFLDDFGSRLDTSRPHLINADSVRVGVLSRVKTRALVGAEQLYDDLVSRLPKGYTFSVNYHFFENYTFFEQVDAVRSADVLLASHGAALGNLIFLRQTSHVIEVLPFAFYIDFKGLTRSVGASHEVIVAEPDPEPVLACLRSIGEHRDELVKLWELLLITKSYVHVRNAKGLVWRNCLRKQSLHVRPALLADLVARAVRNSERVKQMQNSANEHAL